MLTIKTANKRILVFIQFSFLCFLFQFFRKGALNHAAMKS